MIIYIAVTNIGFDVVYAYLPPDKINSDVKFIQQLKTIHKSNDLAIQNHIKTIFRNRPIYICPNIIFYTLPNKQSMIRHHLNVCEIHTFKYKNSLLEVHFYSGQTLYINNIKASAFKRMHHILKLLSEDLTLQR